MDTAYYVIIAMGAVSCLLNTFHCFMLGKRIDNVHERLRLTLRGNGLHDFWNPDAPQNTPDRRPRVTAKMSQDGIG